MSLETITSRHTGVYGNNTFTRVSMETTPSHGRLWKQHLHTGVYGNNTFTRASMETTHSHGRLWKQHIHTGVYGNNTFTRVSMETPPWHGSLWKQHLDAGVYVEKLPCRCRFFGATNPLKLVHEDRPSLDTCDPSSMILYIYIYTPCTSTRISWVRINSEMLTQRTITSRHTGVYGNNTFTRVSMETTPSHGRLWKQHLHTGVYGNNTFTRASMETTHSHGRLWKQHIHTGVYGNNTFTRVSMETPPWHGSLWKQHLDAGVYVEKLPCRCRFFGATNPLKLVHEDRPSLDTCDPSSMRSQDIDRLKLRGLLRRPYTAKYNNRGLVKTWNKTRVHLLIILVEWQNKWPFPANNLRL